MSRNKNDKNRDIARKVYDTVEGRALLADILNDSKFFVIDLEDPRDIALENSAKNLLYKLGIWRPHNIMRIVNALMDMPYLEGEQDG